MCKHLLDKVYQYGKHQSFNQEIDVDVYSACTYHTKRKNALSRWVPGLFKFEHGVHRYHAKEHLRLRYHANGATDVKQMAFYSTSSRVRSISEHLRPEHNFNLYRTNLLDDHILSPVNYRNRNYYQYVYSLKYKEEGQSICRIKINPRINNTQLVKGYIDIYEQTGQIKYFYVEFMYDMLRCHVSGQMGNIPSTTCLPVQLAADVQFKFLGNRFKAFYVSQLDYHIHPRRDTISTHHNPYDLTANYQLLFDTTGVRRDKAYFDSLSYPSLYDLTSLYKEQAKVKIDSVHSPAKKNKNFFRKIDSFFSKPIIRKEMSLEDILFDVHSTKTSHGLVKWPPLLTPEMFHWSHRMGLVLQTKIRAKWNWEEYCKLELHPKFSLSCKTKDIEWQAPLYIEGAHSLRPQFRFYAEGGRTLYSSKLYDEAISLHPSDTLLLRNQHLFQQYKDLSFSSSLAIYPSAGLKTGIGAAYYRRSMHGHALFQRMTQKVATLRTWAPRIFIEWTPHQYFYQKENRKIPIYSNWPTFRLDYEQGIGVGDTHNDYKRVELDMQYHRSLHALRSIYLRVGAGGYIQRKNSYFLSYNYFHDTHILSSLKDEFSGRFYLLPSHYYNESPYYVRASFTYESPMLLLSRFRYLSRFLQKERLYVNTVMMQSYQPYTEIGYGISTHVADVSSFMSITPQHDCHFGVKIAFRWFDEW